jgi:hypothetical protein
MKASAHLILVIALAVLGGCSGPQSAVVVPQSGAAGLRGRPASTSGALLYAVSVSYPNRVLVYDYPGKSLQQTLDLTTALDACSDTSGNVFITAQGDGSAYFGNILEFAHGGSKPIAGLWELPKPGTPGGCSVDPTTGNLAVANGYNIAVFAGAQGTPTYYTISGLSNVNSCAYDNQGNLAASGIANSTSNLGLAILWNGATQFQAYVLHNTPSSLASTIQFDGQKFGLVNFIANRAASLYRVTFTRLSVHFSSGVRLRTGRHGKGDNFSPVSTWIQGKTIIAPYGNNDSLIGFWKYPGGGRVQSSFNTHQKDVRAVTVSVPPSR